MASYLNSEDLINSVIRRAHIPTAQVTFQPDDFLALANEETKLGIIPAVLQYHEEFFVYPNLVPLLPNVSVYPIPSRSIGSKVRDVFYVDGGGNLREMGRINPDDVPFYSNLTTSGEPRHFYLQNNNIVLFPAVSGLPSGSLQINIFQRPNELVTSDKIANVTFVDFNSGIVQLDAVPAGFSGGLKFDFIERGFAHKCKNIDMVASNVNASLKQIVFDPAILPKDLVVGDIVALAGQCNIPQIPDELHPLLAQRVACRCLESQGDVQNLQAANQKLQEMELKMGNLINNRTEGQPIKAVNVRSLLRSGKLRRRRTF